MAAFTLIVGFIATDAADVPLRDPDHVAALYFVLVGIGVALLVGLDVADPRGPQHGHAPAVARGDAAGPARALDAGAVAGRRQRRC